MMMRRWIFVLTAIVACVRPVPTAALTAEQVEAGTSEATRHLRVVLQLLASNRLHGRDNNTDDSRLAQRVLISMLRRFAPGLDGTMTGDDAYKQPFVLSNQTGTNLVAVIRGRELPNEYVLAGAHYDHLGTRSAADGHCTSRGATGGAVCNGATDNAAGVAVILAVAEAIHALPEPPRRSVVLALWDSEEDGLVGSKYYTTHPLVPLADTNGCVNLDIQGQDLLPSLSRTTFAVGSETGGSALQSVVDQAAAHEDLKVHKVSYLLGQERSDYKNFVDKRVPTVFFGDSTGPCYHTTGDDLSIVNYTKLKAQARIAFRVVTALAEAPDRLPFAGKGTQAAVFADVVALDEVFRTARADVDLFSAADRPALDELTTTMTDLVGEGKVNFDTNGVLPFLGAVNQGIDLLTHLECKPQPRR